MPLAESRRGRSCTSVPAIALSAYAGAARATEVVANAEASAKMSLTFMLDDGQPGCVGGMSGGEQMLAHCEEIALSYRNFLVL